MPPLLRPCEVPVVLGGGRGGGSGVVAATAAALLHVGLVSLRSAAGKAVMSQRGWSQRRTRMHGSNVLAALQVLIESSYLKQLPKLRVELSEMTS